MQKPNGEKEAEVWLKFTDQGRKWANECSKEWTNLTILFQLVISESFIPHKCENH